MVFDWIKWREPPPPRAGVMETRRRKRGGLPTEGKRSSERRKDEWEGVWKSGERSEK
jgi:hypothetical protein